MGGQAISTGPLGGARDHPLNLELRRDGLGSFWGFFRRGVQQNSKLIKTFLHFRVPTPLKITAKSFATLVLEVFRCVFVMKCYRSRIFWSRKTIHSSQQSAGALIRKQ